MMKSLIFSKYTIFPQVGINMKNTYRIYSKNWIQTYHLKELAHSLFKPISSGNNSWHLNSVLELMVLCNSLDQLNTGIKFYKTYQTLIHFFCKFIHYKNRRERKTSIATCAEKIEEDRRTISKTLFYIKLGLLKLKRGDNIFYDNNEDDLSNQTVSSTVSLQKN